MTTGKRIQQARKRAGLSQKQLGEKLGLSASMIGQWENDLRHPKTETLLKIADALRVGIGVLAPDLGVVYNAGFDAVIHTKRFRRAKNEEDAQAAEDDAMSLVLYFDDLDKEEQEQAILCLKALAGWSGIGEQRLLPIEELLIAFYMLNLDGQQKAVERVKELTEIPRYRAETAPQSTQAPQEGNDTTPPQDAPETPPEGK